MRPLHLPSLCQEGLTFCAMEIAALVARTSVHKTSRVLAPHLDNQVMYALVLYRLLARFLDRVWLGIIIIIIILLLIIISIITTIIIITITIIAITIIGHFLESCLKAVMARCRAASPLYAVPAEECHRCLEQSAFHNP